MRTILTTLILLLALNSPAPQVPPTPIGLANPKFGIVTSMSSTDYVAIEIAGRPHGMTKANFTNGLATVSYVGIVSNYLLSVMGTNVSVTAGTNMVVEPTIHGLQTAYKLSVAGATGSGSGGNLFTNDNGFVHLNTNGPIVLGTNSGPPAPFYIFSGITNDSMSGAELDFVPLNGVGNNRSGLFVQMFAGDALGGLAPAIYGLSLGTTSNGFGAYCGNNPFGLLGKVQSAGSGDSVATIGNNLGNNTGVRYGVSGLAGGSVRNGNTNVGVFGSGGTNSSVAVGVYAELANGIATATDAKYPLTSALVLNNRQTAGRLATGYTNSVYEVWSLLGNGHMQLNSNDIFSLVAGPGVQLATNGTTLTVSASGTLASTTVTNFQVVSNTSFTLVSQFPVSNGTNFQADMAQGESLIQLTNNLFFQLSTNRAAGLVYYASYTIESGNTNWNLAFNSSWKWIGTTNNPPTTIASNKVAILALKSYGTSETNIVAAYAVQP